MKKGFLTGVLLLVTLAYLGVVRVHADEQTGVIWGIVTYNPPWEHNMFDDLAYILEKDYSPTPFWDWISGSYPHDYWIVNTLPSDEYRLGIYVLDCDKHSVGGPFWYNQGSSKRLDAHACADSEMGR